MESWGEKTRTTPHLPQPLQAFIPKGSETADITQPQEPPASRGHQAAPSHSLCHAPCLGQVSVAFPVVTSFEEAILGSNSGNL